MNFQAQSNELIRQFGYRLSTATILFHSAIADRLGISETDLKCRSILLEVGPLTAGELAQRVGLTTGAITGVIDRLERAGLAHRTIDPKDRRRIILELTTNPEQEKEIGELYASMGTAIIQLVNSYDAAEQHVITSFLEQAIQILESETLKLRQAQS